MKYSPPKPVDLSSEETRLYSDVFEAHDDEPWGKIAESMGALAKALMKRGAIPEIRLRLFSDSEYAETGRKSPREVFESNGCTGSDIFRHAHFKPYLRHFIDGPDLPKEVINGICAILNGDQGTSGMVMDQYRKYARKSVRDFGLDRKKSATEFFRLGAEIGMELDDARVLRNAAMSIR